MIPAIAALRFTARVAVKQAVPTAEGVWVVSSLPASTTGDSSGSLAGTTTYGTVRVAVGEYGEVLLLDRRRQRILRAFPLPGMPPQRILVTRDRVFCERQGDGGLPDSMLCSIDRQTYQWQVRIFPNTTDSGFHPLQPGTYLPSNWKVNSPVGKPMFTSLQWRGHRLRIAGNGFAAMVDPATLRIE